MSERVPAECFPVSEFVIEEMGERGWTPIHLAEMLVWSKLALDALLIQQEPLTEAQAADLERVFGASQRYWLNLELSYRRWKHSARRGQFVRRRPRPRQAATTAEGG